MLDIISEVAPDMLAHCDEQIARLSTMLALLNSRAPSARSAAHIEAVTDELDGWFDAREVYAEQAADAVAPPILVVICAQERAGGQWYAYRTSKRASFHSSRWAILWAREQLRMMRARPFPPREREGVQRLAAQVWSHDPQDAAAPAVLIAELDR